MKKLIIINGAPGVGKTTAGRLLFKSLPDSTFLDGDDVWQLNPFVVNEATKELAIKNITCVLRAYLQSSYKYVIFVWVLHKQEIIDTILRNLNGIESKRYIFTLTAEEEVLRQRIKTETGAARNESLALDRLRNSLMLNTMKIDSGCFTPGEIKDKILAEVQKEQQLQT